MFPGRAEESPAQAPQSLPGQKVPGKKKKNPQIIPEFTPKIPSLEIFKIFLNSGIFRLSFLLDRLLQYENVDDESSGEFRIWGGSGGGAKP